MHSKKKGKFLEGIDEECNLCSWEKFGYGKVNSCVMNFQRFVCL